LLALISVVNMSDIRLVIYTRTSTHNGAAADSLEAQEEACRSWAQRECHQVVSVFRDEALSGGLGMEGRPGLAAALVTIADGDADGLVVHRVDRLARELHVQEAALANAWAAGEHVKVFEVVEGGEISRDDPDDPNRKFLRQVWGAAAELEKGMIRARLQGGRRRKAARGGYIGGKQLHPRYGYDLVDGEYVAKSDEQAVIARMRELRAGGATWAATAAALNEEDVTPPSGKAWYPMTARRILNREDTATG
jgi:DNA invertase Pin-like site-specific DNA recombinase